MVTNNNVHWKQVAMAVSFVTLVSLISTSIPLVYKYFGWIAQEKQQITLEAPVVVSTITKEGIEAGKSNLGDLLQQTKNYKRIDLLSSPIDTPSFVTNPDKLRDYLEQKNVAIVIEGKIDKAYLYIKVKQINISSESVYFFVVDGYSKQGHLVSSESLISGSGNDFLFDLSQLPLSSLPFPLESKEKKINVINEFLNKDLSYKKERKYYVGGFVSTTQLPNSLDVLQIRYTCPEEMGCLIRIVQK